MTGGPSFDKTAFIAECERRRAAGFMVSGGYAVRDKIKAAGGTWDSFRKAWLMPDQASTDAMRALAGVSTGTVRSGYREPRGCRCDGRPGGYCCGRRDCQCYDCQ